MQNAGGFDSKDYPLGLQYYRLAVLGNGTGNPTAPGNGIIPPLWPVKASVMSLLTAEAPNRTGLGVYTITVAARWRTVAWLSVDVEIFGTAGAWGQVSALSPTAGTLTLRTFSAGGTATDVTTADLVVMTITALDTSVYK